MNNSEFRCRFKDLTDHEPLSWQWRLFENHFANGELPREIDLPTGLGKTMVMAIWLIAREVNKQLPRRLIYVVDRRTVVDQASNLAERMVTKWGKSQVFDGEPPAISTLRGQRADNREWSRDLSKPAIIIGTVDLIGSALLFSGYRSSFKRRPLEAGLLGQDSLLVLDEAHLSRPFEKLVTSITELQRNHGSPLRVIRMSATSGNSTGSKPFSLQFGDDGNLTGEDAKDDTITKRFGASKTLSVVKSETPIETIATEADKLATKTPGSRIVIFVQTPKRVAEVRKALEKKNRDYAQRIAQLTGTMRGLERDELVDLKRPLQSGDHERGVMQRFLKPDNDPAQGECFLISTSAGEVGFDLNADHMVCDATTIDSLIQRLGRVNRRGLGAAQVHLIVEPRKKDKDGKPKALDLAIADTIDLLRDVTDVSPKNIASLKSGDWKNNYAAACSPDLPTVELTDILLDNWSMTSITEPMPGRPEVAPWLRGIAEWEPPQTTIAWRAELDLDGFADLDLDDIEEWFDTHCILTHETLSVNTIEATDWFKKRWAALSEARRSELATRPVIVDRTGIEVISLGNVINRLSLKADNADAFLHGAELIVPASFGGIRRGIGLLDPAEPKLDKAEEKMSPDEQAKIFKVRQESIDVADVRGRHREQIEKFNDGEAVSTALDPKAVKPASYVRYSLELTSDDDRTLRLVSYVPQPEQPEVGSTMQTLATHVRLVRAHLDSIVSRLDLPESLRLAAEFAADWHDHGKNRERWQRMVNGVASPPGEDWSNQTIGKSGGEMKRDPRRYRHEFGSLCEFTEAFNAGKLSDQDGSPISQDVFDLAIHLIAAHHGRGRPHFPQGGFDPNCDEARSEEIHTEAIRRFGRLQRKYGWWGLAWMENLLRCADALASANRGTEGEPAGAEGDAT